MGFGVGTVIGLLIIGVLVGMVSGMLGVGGAIFVIPLLMFFFQFTQPRANGTSLAMLLPPIGIFAVMTYARGGLVDWKVAALLAVGFAPGAYFGAMIVRDQYIHPTALRVCFGLFLIYVAGNMLFKFDKRAGAVLATLALVGGYAATYVGARALGKRWERVYSIGEIYRRRLQSPIAPDYEI